MIKIFRQDNMSIDIEFDMNGNYDLLRMFNELYKKQEYKLNVELDMRVIKMGKREVIKNLIIVCNKSEEKTSFIMKDDNIVWKIEQDDIEFGIEKFTECTRQGYFFPSEFIRIHTPKNKRLDYVYCKLVHEMKY